VWFVGLVLVRDKEMEGIGRLGEDAHCFGTAEVYWIGVAIEREDVGDPVHHGHEGENVTGVRLGDEKFQPCGVGLASADEPIPLCCLCSVFGRVGISFNDEGAQDEQEAVPRQSGQMFHDSAVDQAGRFVGQLTGGLGDPSRF